MRTYWKNNRIPLIIVCLTIVVIVVMYVVYLITRGPQGEPLKAKPINILTNLYLIIALAGATFGGLRLREQPRPWGRPQVVVALFCVALLFWSIAQMVWIYQSFTGEPFPSVADVFYTFNLFLLIVGVYTLFKHLGANIQDDLGPFLTVLIGLWILIDTVISFFAIELRIDSLPDDYYAFFFDYFYPAMSALNLALIGSLAFGRRIDNQNWSFQTKLALHLMLFGAFCDYSGDLLFTATNAISNNSLAYFDGNIADVFFALSMCFWSLAVVSMPLPSPKPQDQAQLDITPVQSEGQIESDTSLLHSAHEVLPD